MADSNHNRRDDYLEFSENDPFAELTRIMGHDPREPQTETPVQEQAVTARADSDPDFDFNLDLERELAADLDFSDFEEPPVQPEAYLAVEQPVTAASSTTVEQPAPDWSELDAGFDDFFAAGVTEAEPVTADYQTYQPEMPMQETDHQGYESLGDALEQELLADQALWTGPEPVYVEPAYAEPAHIEPAYDAAAYQAQPVYEEAEAAFPEETAPASMGVGPEIAEDDWAVEAEFDVDFLERELAAATVPAEPENALQPELEPHYEALSPPPASFEGEPFGEREDLIVAEPAEQIIEEPVDRPLSLEEELQLLLADEPIPAPVAPYVADVSPFSEQQSIAAATDYGRANFSAAQSPVMPAAVTAPVFVTAAVESPYASAEQSGFSSIETSPEAYQPAVEEELMQPQETAAGDGFDDIFGDDFTFDLEEEINEIEPAVASAPELPDIETIEVAETVPPVSDDLDIPEIDYGAATVPTSDFHDDFQSDFDHLFGDVTTSDTRAVIAETDGETAAQQQTQYDDLLDNMQWQTQQPVDPNYSPDSSYSYESDLEQAIAMSAYEDEPVRPASSRRGLFVAAAVGGVVVLGGLGVFGMSMLGGGSDNPAIVRADPDPMKVRPENPGGTTVPNQDNEVYQRVAGGNSNAGPQQEQLITSAEEPVDVVARTITPQEPVNTLAPGVDDEVTDTRPAKSEERIEQEPQATSPVETQETAMVTPRRVRTMVVRSDGTMVPREEPLAAPAETITAEQPAISGEASALAPMNQSVQPSDEIDSGPTVEMPQTVSVVPTQRSRALQPATTPQTAAPQQAAPQAQVSAPAQVAAAPVTAPATAPATAIADEWSMQIASQPTAEGAQASYQDLARRYGSVLEGRGVSIVRADIDGRGTYYRVRIPASSRDEAIQLCTRYKAAGGSCFVSR